MVAASKARLNLELANQQHLYSNQDRVRQGLCDVLIAAFRVFPSIVSDDEHNVSLAHQLIVCLPAVECEC